MQKNNIIIYSLALVYEGHDRREPACESQLESSTSRVILGLQVLGVRPRAHGSEHG